ncbi:MAG: CAP domain-containing protein [Planctomycetota bacterium]|nr:MAG: CAP domain-containing protein [Planctomycetota bacterium]
MHRIPTSLAWLLALALACGGWGCGGSSSGGGVPPATGSTSGGDTDPTLGSRFWYVGDAFGQPLKTHTAAESTDANDVLTQLNAYRVANGLNALTLDAEATRAAKAHAEDMQGRDYFSHQTPAPENWDPGDRLSLLGASGYSGWGENIARGQQTPTDVMTAWQNSPGHDANMLNPNWTHVGVGVEHDGVNPSGPYWVQVFLRRP